MERMCRIIFRLFAFTSDTSPFVIRQPTIHNYIKPSYYILHDSIDKYHKYSFDNVFEYGIISNDTDHHIFHKNF